MKSLHGEVLVHSEKKKNPVTGSKIVAHFKT